MKKNKKVPNRVGRE